MVTSSVLVTVELKKQQHIFIYVQKSFNCLSFIVSPNSASTPVTLLYLPWMAVLMWMFLANMWQMPVTTYILVLIPDCLHFHVSEIIWAVNEVITGIDWGFFFWGGGFRNEGKADLYF